MAGPENAQSRPAWLPFRPPPASSSQNYAKDNKTPKERETERARVQLQGLASRLGDDSKFLSAFWDVITRASDNMLPTPDAYAGFSNTALVGRPLALAHAGWSLELAANQLTSQAVRDNSIPRVLLGDDDNDKNDKDVEKDQIQPESRPSSSKLGEPEKPKRYIFPTHIGSTQRAFDGLVGVFKCDQRLGSQTDDLGVDLHNLYSDFIHDKHKGKLGSGILPGEPLHLRAFYPDVPLPQPVEKQPQADAAVYASSCTAVEGYLMTVGRYTKSQREKPGS
ncbi:hypothetical protein QBC35DRAFT_476828 [Podospora australis]|uniref:Uncharacterized protein n=1 Tax=Podospora australis TaxID=1536484 RepID=A0AAN6WNK5_9PEZI|nr:hypothetical protein QBC35DRAFT_476828 [Podospora australis]